MPYYSMKEFNLEGFEKSKTKHKMYDAIIQNKKTKKNVRVPFGDKRYQNYQDLTGLNLYPKLIHGDKERRSKYWARHKGFIKKGFYSPGYFSLHVLW